MVRKITFQEGKNGAMDTARSERDEILNFFFARLEPFWTKGKLTKTYFGMKTSHLKLEDLYYMKSVCLDAERRKQDFVKTFWGMLRVR